MIKVAFIGAGSTVFARVLMRDLLRQPDLGELELRLMDIDPERLRVTEQVARHLAQTLGAPARIVSTTDRRQALDGVQYVICLV